MIGQNKLLSLIDNQLLNNVFPRFSILVAPKGYGKKTLALEIAKSLCYYPTLVTDTSIGNLRSIIEMAYTTLDSQVYIITDCDSMSMASKNCLLKVLEEPPNNAYFIMTIVSEHNLLPTIKSRGTIYRFDPYTTQELSSYIKIKSYNVDDRIFDIVDCPGDIDLVMSIGINELYNYTELVLDNIEKVSDANAFKIANKLALKKDTEGIDLGVFWNTFRALCIKHNEEDRNKYYTGLLITNRYANQLGYKTLNKQYLFDGWLLNIREAWAKYDERSNIPTTNKK